MSQEEEANCRTIRVIEQSFGRVYFAGSHGKVAEMPKTEGQDDFARSPFSGSLALAAPFLGLLRSTLALIE